MVLNRESSQLTRVETGVLASLGFVGLGAALGLIPAVVAGVDKMRSTPPVPASWSDIVSLGVFCACVMLALVALTIAGLTWRCNKGLAAKTPRDF